MRRDAPVRRDRGNTEGHGRRRGAPQRATRRAAPRGIGLLRGCLLPHTAETGSAQPTRWPFSGGGGLDSASRDARRIGWLNSVY